MAEFGSVITAVGVDLEALDKGLAEARARLKKFYDDAGKMAVAVHAGGARVVGVSGGGVSGGGGGGGRPSTVGRLHDVSGVNFDPASRTPGGQSGLQTFEVARVARDREEDEARRFLARKRRAEDENARQAVSIMVTHNRAVESEEARNERYRKEIAQREQERTKARLNLLDDAKKKADALVAAERKIETDAGKEFESISRGAIRQGGTEALAKARLADKERTEELKRSADAAKRLAQHVGAFKQGLQDALVWAKQIAPFLGAGLAAGIGAAVTEAFNLNRELQLQRLTLAADLELTTKIVDAHGRYVGLQKELQINLAQTPAMLKQIRQEAEKTTLTEQELRTVVARNLAPALRAGKGSTPTSAIDMISQLGNAARVFGAGNENQVSSEVRGILNASPLVRRSILGGALGIDPKQLKDAQEAGTLFQLLQKRLALIQPLLDQANVTFDHLFSTLISKGKDFLQLALQDVFQRITGKILDLNSALTDETIQQYAKTFSEALGKIYDWLERAGRSQGFKDLIAGFRYLAEHAQALIGIFTAIKAIQVANNVTKFVQDLKSVLTAGAGTAGGAAGPGGLVGLLAGAARKRMGAGGAAAGPGSELASVGGSDIGTFLPGAGGLGVGAAAGGATVAATMGIVLGSLADILLAGKLVQLWTQKHQADLQAAQALQGTREIRLRAIAIETQRLQRQTEQPGFADLEGMARFAAARALPGATARERQAGTGITPGMSPAEIAQRLPGILQQGSIAGLHRVARTYGDEEAKKKKRATDLAVWLRRLLAKGTEDEKEQNRLRYEADARSVYDKLGLTKQANQVVAQLHQQLVEKDAEIDEQNAEAQRKFLADLKNDKLAALKEEYQEHLDTIKAMTLTDAQAHQDQLAALQAYQRARADQIRGWTDKERDLAAEAVSDKQELHNKEAAMLRETHDLQLRFSRESRDLIHEEADAQRDLQRAQIDRQAAQKRLFGTPAVNGQFERGAMAIRQLPGGTLVGSSFDGGAVVGGRAAQPGMMDEQQAILQAAQRALNPQVGVIQQQLQRANPALSAPLAQAQAQAEVRTLIEEAQRQGGTQAVTGRLRQLGISSTPEFAGQLQGIETRTLNLQGRQQAADQAQQAEQLRREKEDVGKPEIEARRRIADLLDRETKLRTDYVEGIKRQQDAYRRELIDGTSTFVKLTDAVKKFARELADSGMSIAPQFRAILAPFLHLTQAQAHGQVAHALAPVYHITFGPGSLQVKDLSAAELKRAVSELLQREARNAAPARR